MAQPALLKGLAIAAALRAAEQRARNWQQPSVEVYWGYRSVSVLEEFGLGVDGVKPGPMFAQPIEAINA